MKKFLLITLILLISSQSFAQKKRGYEASAHIGAAADTRFTILPVSCSFVGGYRFNEYIFLGGGAGLYHPVQLKTKDGGGDNPELYTNFLQFFAEAKCNFSSGKISPFVSMGAGYMSSFGSEQTAGKYSTFFVRPAMGFDVNLGESRKNALSFQIGIFTMGDRFRASLSDGKMLFRPELRIGYRF